MVLTGMNLFSVRGRLIMDDTIDIDYVANLARLELSMEEKEEFSPQLARVLDYFETLKEIKVDGVEPTAHAFPVYNVWQEDKSEPGFTVEQALKNAPAKRENQIIVSKVIE
jgi:aspartyl-tRNA(Asn)/glutamyl-tRNA(Gln) amidotransferase subunit C